MPREAIDETGNTYGRLKVIQRVASRGRGARFLHGVAVEREYMSRVLTLALARFSLVVVYSQSGLPKLTVLI